MSWMSGCGKDTVQIIPTKFSYKEVRSTCGQTSFHGGIVLCEDCEARAERLYPQGWSDIPGDTCEHGNYIGTPGGYDYICGLCEMGEKI